MESSDVPIGTVVRSRIPEVSHWSEIIRVLWDLGFEHCSHGVCAEMNSDLGELIRLAGSDDPL